MNKEINLKIVDQEKVVFKVHKEYFDLSKEKKLEALYLLESWIVEQRIVNND